MCGVPQELIRTHYVMSFWISLCFSLSLNSNLDCVVSLGSPCCSCRGRVSCCFCLQPLLAAPFDQPSHYKRQRWGRGHSLSSSACNRVLLVAPDDQQLSEDVDMTVSVRTPRSTRSPKTLLVESDTSQILHVPLNRIPVKHLRTNVGHIVA